MTAIETRVGVPELVTSKFTEEVWTRPPPVPVIANGYVPGRVFESVFTLKVDVPDFKELGLKEAVAPEGKPVTDNVTVPVKPVPGATLAVKVVPPPCTTVCVVGLADNPKLGTTVIVRVGGFGSLSPLLSETVRETTSLPVAENMTGPGFCNVLALGFPPGNTQEKPVIVPLVAVPVPEKFTDCPAPIVTLPVGLKIVPDGGTPPLPPVGNWTKVATDGTPEEFSRNSM